MHLIQKQNMLQLQNISFTDGACKWSGGNRQTKEALRQVHKGSNDDHKYNDAFTGRGLHTYKRPWRYKDLC